MRRHAAPVVALAALHVAAFSLLVFREHGAPYAVIPFDFRSLTIPSFEYAADVLHTGQWPWWCPYSSAGTPYFLSPGAHLLFPLSWPGFLFGYSPYLSQLQAVFTVLLGGIGVYALCFHLFGSRSGALFGAAAFDLSSAVFGHMESLSALEAYALAPWLFLAILRRSKWAPLQVALLAAMMVAGVYPAAGAMILGWATLLVLLTLPGKRERLLLLAGSGLGLLLAAGHWLPIALHAGDFTRGAALDLHTSLFDGHLSFRHIWSAVFPFMTVNPLPGPEPDVSMRGFYFGALCLPAALAGILGFRDGRTRALLLFGAAAFLLACGGHFFGRTALHAALPVFRFSRFPALDSGPLAVLAAALLGGAGVTLIGRGDQDALRRMQRGCAVLLVLLVLGLGLFRLLYPADVWNRVVLTFTSAEIFCVGAAFLVLHALDGRARVLALCALLSLELGTSVIANFGIIGQPVDPREWAAYEAARRPRATLQDVEADRKASPGYPVVDEPASDAYHSKSFWLTAYNPLRLRRYDALLENGFRDFLEHPGHRRAVALPSGADVKTGAELAATARPLDYRIASYEANTVTYGVRLPQPARVVFNEIGFPGWRASIDGDPDAAMIEVGPGLRALEVPAGEHVIETVFSPPEGKAALGLSAIGLLLAALWATRIRARREA